LVDLTTSTIELDNTIAKQPVFMPSDHFIHWQQIDMDFSFPRKISQDTYKGIEI